MRAITGASPPTRSRSAVCSLACPPHCDSLTTVALACPTPTGEKPASSILTSLLIQPYQTSTYIPPEPGQYQPIYTPPSSTSPDPRRPPSHRRRSHSLSSAPRRSHRKKKSSDDADMTSGVLGALAGGLVGSSVAPGAAVPAVVAAAIGAVGANRLEKRQKRKKEKDRAGR